MESFEGKLAVVTGGGTGMGRELVVQLVEQGAHVAMCDVQPDAMETNAAIAAERAPSSDLRVTRHTCDVSDGVGVELFAEEVKAQHDVDHVDLLFNNAGVGGGGSFVAGDRAEWERTFDICWGGVYHCARAFVPLLVASNEAVLVNTSSVNGFWASLGPGIPHTAYSAAKFAVKGFTEALLEDFRVNAPHVRAVLVMPGHIGTEIVNNSRLLLGTGGVDPETIREAMTRRGFSPEGMTDDQLVQMAEGMGDMFRDSAPTSAEAAATTILDAVKAGEWRVLVGDDAVNLDEAARSRPLEIYGPGGLTLGVF